MKARSVALVAQTYPEFDRGKIEGSTKCYCAAKTTYTQCT